MSFNSFNFFNFFNSPKTMKSFLEKVATDILSKYGDQFSRTAVVFPNKRASLFFNTHLAAHSDRPLWSPSYITISDLFRKHSRLTVADPIKQVCDLHKSFAKCTGIDETLDHFYGWGQLLLSDFDDIDKNMADAKKVFANLADIHELDDVSYLTPEQVEAIRKFFSNFSEEHNSELKRRFLMLWSKFNDIYNDFNQRLLSQGLAYEGALYRKVVTDETVTFSFDRYIFVGFNVLQKVEQRLFSRLMAEGKAKFYWDFDKYYMTSNGMTDNEAGHYIKQYLQHFPNELDNHDDETYNNFSREKQITFISSTTENAQARYVSQWLRENNRISDGRRTAIVMCDEALLKSVIHCIPDEVEQANITTGYPLSQSPVSSFVMSLFALQTVGYIPHSDRYRLKAVSAVLSHPYSRYVSDRCGELLKSLTNPPIYYVSRDKLCIDDGTTALFASVGNSGNATLELTQWALKVVRAIANGSHTADDGDPLFEESLFRTYTLLNRLESLISSGDLTVDVVTLQRLVGQLIQSTSIPFHGEPAVGLQIMGVLETRNLDFDHLLILSCNDGNMPRGVSDTSFIPYSIRKAYELTTIDNKVSIYSYYFHRLLQRANDITIMYNNAANDTSTGEMSRFMQQMLVESGHTIKQRKLRFELNTPFHRPSPIEKDERVMAQLLARFDADRRTDDDTDRPILTPTAINRYMRCPLQFYYYYVANLKEQEDVLDDDMQQRLFGNIFHGAAETIYRQLAGADGGRISRESLQAVLNAKIDIERAVDEAFKEELFKADKHSNYRPEYNGLQLINREVIITYLRRLLEVDKQLAPFYIVGLEVDVAESLTVDLGNGKQFQTRIGGRIDRLDSVDSDGIGRIRVIDYKTGRDNKGVMNTVEDIFDTENLHKHNDYYLQTFIYSKIVRHDARLNPHGDAVSPALLFIQNATGDNYDPTLCLSKKPMTDIADVSNIIDTLLKAKVNEMFNAAEPFAPTPHTERCASCPYANLCGL